MGNREGLICAKHFKSFFSLGGQMHEVNFLTENGVKVVSIKDGELNAETLPLLFRKLFRLVGHNS